MDRTWLLTIALAGCVAFAIQAVYLYFRFDRPTAKRVNRRLTLLDSGVHSLAALDTLRRERGVGLKVFGSSLLENLVVQSGLRLNGNKIVLVLVLACAVGVLLGILVLPLGTAVPIGILVGALGLFGYITVVRRKRIRIFGEQLPEAIDVVVRSMKSGHPLPVAINLVAREMADPAGSEFGLLNDELAYGLDLRTAMANLYYRVGSPDLLYLMTAVSIQSETGGNLVELLSRMAHLLRERFKLARKVRSLSAEGRFSGVALSLLPFAVGGFIVLTTPQYYLDVIDDPAFPPVVYTCAVLLFMGNFIMYKMINFKY